MKRILFLLSLLIISISNTFADYTRILIDDLYYDLNTTDYTATVISQPNVAAVTNYDYLDPDLIIPPKVYYQSEWYTVTKIANHAFWYCKSIESVTIPNTVVEIGDKEGNGGSSNSVIVFYRNPKLKKIIFEDGDEPLYLGFNYDSSGSGVCLFVNTATQPHPLEEVYLGRNLKFSVYYSVNGGGYLPHESYPSRYGYSPFYRTSLKKVTIGPSVSSLPPYLFYEKSDLSELEILTNSITRIPKYCFYNCTSLTGDLIISENVSLIDENAFNGPKFNNIICKKEIPPSCGLSVFMEDLYSSATLTVPYKSLDRYKNTYPWENFFIINYDSPKIEKVKIEVENSKAKVGQLISASATVSPEEIDDYKLQWGSDNSGIIKTLMEDGKFLATGSGKTNIKVTASNDDGSVSDEVEIEVEPSYISADKFTIKAGGTASVSLNTSDIPGFEYRGFLFDLYVPDGIKVKNVEINADLNGFNGAITEKEGYYSVVYISSTSQNLNPGTVKSGFLTLNLEAEKDVSVNDNATISFNNIFFVHPESSSTIKFTNSQINFSIEEITVTDLEIFPGKDFPADRKDKDGYYQLYVDETVSFSISTQPVDAPITDLEYKTNNTGAVDIEYAAPTKTFTITGKKFGSETVIISVPSYNVNSELKIKVVPTPMSVKISDDKKSLRVGDNYNLNAVVDPDNESKTGKVTLKWSSDSENILVVESTGMVTGMKIGKALIKVTASYGINGELTTSDQLEIEVLPVMPEAVTITSLSLEGKEGKTDLKATEWLYLTAEVSPSNSSYKEIEWSVSHDDHIDIEIHPDDNGEGTMFIAKVRDNVVQDNVTITATVKDTQVNGSVIVNIAELLLGDADDDLEIDVADVVTTAHWIVENRPESFCFVNADTDADKSIDVGDLTATVDIALHDGNATKQASRSHYSNGSLSSNSLSASATTGRNSTGIEVAMKGGTVYKALQADITLPAGMRVTDVIPGNLAENHQLFYNLTEEGILKTVVFSVANIAFTNAEGTLFTIIVEGTSSVATSLDITDIIAVDMNSEKHLLPFEGVSISDEAGIDGIGDASLSVSGGEGYLEINSPSPVAVDIFTVDGMHVRHIDLSQTNERIYLAKGIYIVTVNGEAFKTSVK